MSAGFRAGQANDGYLQINGTDILTVSSGVLGVKNTGAQSEVRLYCESNNAHYASLKSPPHSDFIGNVTFTLPGTSGSNGQVLQTDGSGNLSWVTQSGGGGGGGVSDKMSEGNTEAEVVDTGSDGHFKVTTEGVERLRITSGGQSTFIKRNNNADDLLFGYGTLTGIYAGIGGYNNFNTNQLCDLTFWTNGSTGSCSPTERLRIKSDGKIGINNSAPLYAMHFKNAMGSSPSFIHMEVTGSNAVGGGGGIAFDTSASNNASNNTLYLATIAGIRNSADNGSNDLVFSTAKSGVNNNIHTEKLRIGSAGQIGLGGANYGTSGQVLTSGGASGAVSWTTISGGGGSYGNSDVDNHINSGAASSGQILSWNGSDYAWVADQGGSGGGGISDIVDDTTPQLGGNLDLNSRNITGTGNINITGDLDITGDVEIDTLTASGTANFNGSVDFNGAVDVNAHVEFKASGGNSQLYMYDENAINIGSGNDARIVYNNTGNIVKFERVGSAGEIEIDAAPVTLQHSNSTKLQTTSTGVTVTGTLTATTFSGSGANLTNLPGLSNVVEDTTPQLGGNLDVQAREINTSTSNGNIKLAPNGTGVVEIRGAGGGDGTLQLNCSAQSHGIKLKSPPHSAAASYTLTFPNSIVADKFLTSDSSGNLSFSSELTDLVVKQSGSAFTKQSQTVALFQRSSTTGHGAKIAIVGGNAASSDINFGDTDDEDAGLIQYVHADNSFKFCTNGDITNEKLRITSDGKIGVGQGSPQGDLHIGNISGSKNLIMHAANNGDALIRFREGGSNTSGFNEYSIGMDGGRNSLVVNGQGVGEIIAVNGDTGKVGINQVTPTAFMHVKSGANDGTVISTFEGATNNKLDVKFISTGPAINVTAGDPLVFEMSGSEKLRITAAGLLDVSGGIHVTENVTPASGRGIEIFEASAGVGQIQSFNRTGGSWDELRLKGSEVAIYTGTSNSIGLYLQSTQSTLYGTSDGILNLDSTDARGAFMRFKQSGSTKAWVGSAEGMGGGLSGDQDDLGLRAIDNIMFSANGAERLRIDSNGKIGVGVTPDIGWQSSTTSTVLQVKNGVLFDYGTAQFDVGHNYFYDGTNYRLSTLGYASRMTFQKSDGSIRFWALPFGLNGSTATPVEKVRILRSGGITFNGDSAEANALDDYEEGTYNPSISFQTSGSATLNTSFNTLSYIKIGRLVTINGQLRIASVSSPVGNMAVGLPFTVTSTTQLGRSGGGLFWLDISAGSGNYYKNIPFIVEEGSTTLRVENVHFAGAVQFAASDEISFAVTYVSAT